MKSLQMKKLAVGTIAAAAMFMTAPVTQAATLGGTFNVSASLSSLCTLVPGGPPTVNFGTYVAFQALPVTAPTVNIAFNCTRGLGAPTMALDIVNGTSTAVGTVAGAAATGDGVLPAVGLNYNISVTGSKTAVGVAPTTAVGNIGSADTYTFAIVGTMPSGQAGTCATGTCGPDTQIRTLTITY